MKRDDRDCACLAPSAVERRTNLHHHRRCGVHGGGRGRVAHAPAYPSPDGPCAYRSARCFPRPDLGRQQGDPFSSTCACRFCHAGARGGLLPVPRPARRSRARFRTHLPRPTSWKAPHRKLFRVRTAVAILAGSGRSAVSCRRSASRSSPCCRWCCWSAAGPGGNHVPSPCWQRHDKHLCSKPASRRSQTRGRSHRRPPASHAWLMRQRYRRQARRSPPHVPRCPANDLPSGWPCCSPALAHQHPSGRQGDRHWASTRLRLVSSWRPRWSRRPACPVSEA